MWARQVLVPRRRRLSRGFIDQKVTMAPKLAMKVGPGVELLPGNTDLTRSAAVLSKVLGTSLFTPTIARKIPGHKRGPTWEG